MIAGVKRLAREVAATTGVFSLARMLSAHLPRIIVYHHFCGPDEAPGSRVSAAAFRQQLAYIKRNYRPVKLSELGRALAGGGTLPPGLVAVTVDDGYADFRRWAFPLLAEFEIPATLFVVSDLPGTGQWIWADRFMYLRDRASGVPELAPQTRAATLTTLKRMTGADHDRRLRELAEQAGVTIPEQAPDEYALLTWAELRELVASGLVEIGSHTCTHRVLAHEAADRAWNEIDGSRRELERRLGVAVTCFCYPNGKAGDYRPDQREMVQRAGYVCATASHVGYVTAGSNRFALPRLGGQNEFAAFRKHLDGFEYLQRRVAGARCC